jgi:hypothetical protein
MNDRMIITRLYEKPIVGDIKLQTIGHAVVANPLGIIIFDFHTLELPYLDNKKQISCILAGVYKCVKRWSKKYGWHWHVLDVEGRTLILIHFGNYFNETLGCILVGKDLKDLNKDGLEDVTDSLTTMNKLRSILPDEFELEIKYRN